MPPEQGLQKNCIQLQCIVQHPGEVSMKQMLGQLSSFFGCGDASNPG